MEKDFHEFDAKIRTFLRIARYYFLFRSQMCVFQYIRTAKYLSLSCRSRTQIASVRNKTRQKDCRAFRVGGGDTERVSTLRRFDLSQRNNGGR